MQQLKCFKCFEMFGEKKALLKHICAKIGMTYNT